MTSDCEVPNSCLAWDISIHQTRSRRFFFEGPALTAVSITVIGPVALLAVAVFINLGSVSDAGPGDSVLRR